LQHRSVHICVTGKPGRSMTDATGTGNYIYLALEYLYICICAKKANPSGGPSAADLGIRLFPHSFHEGMEWMGRQEDSKVQRISGRWWSKEIGG